MQSHRIIVYESMLAFLTYFLMPPKSSQSSRICFNLQKSIHHNMTEHTSSHEGKCSQRMLQRLLQIQIGLHSLSHSSPSSFSSFSPCASTQTRDKAPCDRCAHSSMSTFGASCHNMMLPCSSRN